MAHTAACVSKLAYLRSIKMAVEDFKVREVLAVAVHTGFAIRDVECRR